MKKNFRTSSKLLGFGMMCLLVNSPTRGMDSTQDPYWKDGDRKCSQYHVGMKNTSNVAYEVSKVWLKEDTKVFLSDPPSHVVTKLDNINVDEINSCHVVCSYCKNYVLQSPVTEMFYKSYFNDEMVRQCSITGGEATFYRWKLLKN